MSLDLFEVAINVMMGLAPDGKTTRITCQLLDSEPGIMTLDNGRQIFGSGGYYASWQGQGTFEVLETVHFANGFISGETTKIRPTSPLWCVTQFSGDAVGDGRDWSWRMLFVPADEQHDLLERVVYPALRQLDDAELKNRCYPSQVRLRATEILQDRARLYQEKERDRLRRRQQAALKKARKYAGDEATARRMAHLFMDE